MRFSVNDVSIRGPLGESEVFDVWPKAEAMFDAALQRDGWKLTTADLLSQVSEGLVGIYLIEDEETGELLAVLAVEVQEYPQSNVLNLAYCGGHDLYRWAGLLGAMESEAARLGCDTVRITGRPGWGRIFPDYSEAHRVFERKVVLES